MVKLISKLVLRLLGWKIVLEYAGQLPAKYVLIAMPHTSNWDFPLGIVVRGAMGWDVKYVGKDSLFRPPLGWLMRWLGGYPVNRSQSSNYVDSVADIFNRKENFAICIAPEGTRKKVSALRTGFYYIALKAEVPIVMGKLDWERKEIVVSEPFMPTGDKEADFDFILDYYKGTKGRHPELGFV
jgi:1-acyl-sn-glycerol-3-phosphate acyltransferase